MTHLADRDITTLGAVIKVTYEAEPNTNAYTDAEKTKLAGIENNATADQTGAEIKTAYEAEPDTNAFDDAAVSKLAGIEDNATADLTAGEVKTLYESNADTNEFSDAEETKLAGIEDSADVTDTANVDAAGAVMHSDISESDGILQKTGSETYVALKFNLTATSNPTVDNDITEGYSVGSRWINVTDDLEFVCLDATDGAAVWLQTTGGSGTGGISALYKTGAYTAETGDIIFADSSGGIFTITLPLTPNADDNVSVFDLGDAATNNITIDRNGETIDGLAEDFILDENHGKVQFIYTGTDWEVSIVTPGAGLTEAQVEELVADTVRGFTKQQYFPEAALTDAANIAWNLDGAQTARVTLAGNRTLDNPTNMKAGATYILRVIQDATGSRMLAFGNAYHASGGTLPVMSTAANAVDLLTFYCDGTNMIVTMLPDVKAPA